MSVASWFVTAPAGRRDVARETPAARVAGRIAVLLPCGAGEHGLGAVLALALAREGGASTVLHLGWHVPGPLRCAAPGRPAGLRLARTLRDRDLPARAVGRLVHVTLPAADGDAAAAVARAVAASPAEAPVVIALGGARGPALDGLLVDADLVVVAGPPEDPRARAAAEGLVASGTPAMLWNDAPGLPWRRLARAGLAVGPIGRLPAGAGR